MTDGNEGVNFTYFCVRGRCLIVDATSVFVNFSKKKKKKIGMCNDEVFR